MNLDRERLERAERIAGQLRAGTRSARLLSVWQPWASLIAAGVKRFETRAWQPRRFLGGDWVPWRGLIAIHAARTTVVPSFGPDLQRILDRHGLGRLEELPRGKVVGLVELLAIVPTERAAEIASDDELAAGDWSPGRLAWDLELVGRPAVPIPARGSQGLRPCPRDVELALADSLVPLL